jgi:hypothetical protein
LEKGAAKALRPGDAKASPPTKEFRKNLLRVTPAMLLLRKKTSVVLYGM